MKSNGRIRIRIGQPTSCNVLNAIHSYVTLQGLVKSLGRATKRWLGTCLATEVRAVIVEHPGVESRGLKAASSFVKVTKTTAPEANIGKTVPFAVNSSILQDPSLMSFIAYNILTTCVFMLLVFLVNHKLQMISFRPPGATKPPRQR